MANLKIGSQGDEVRKVQEALGFTGSDVDGIYGPKTDKAVKEFQEKNGITVDGVVGPVTSGLLFGTSNGNTAAGTTSNTGTNTSTNTSTGTSNNSTASKPMLYGNFNNENAVAQMDAINEAYAVLQQKMSSMPGAYRYGQDYDLASDYLSRYENRDQFSYDVNKDALYQQYKDQYIQQGQLAMMDTLGQAATMTGGYGNSYAQMAGQQAYNQQLSQLNNVVPELYGMAYDQYEQEGQNLLNMYDLYMGREQDKKALWQDSYNMWADEVSMAKDNYTTLYDEFIDAYGQNYIEENDRYNKLLNMVQSGYNPSDAELAAAGMTRKEADTHIYNAKNAGKKNEMSLEEQKQFNKTVQETLDEHGLEKGLFIIGEMLDQAGYSDSFIEKAIDHIVSTYSSGNT